MKFLLFCILILTSVFAFACKIRYPSESDCTVEHKINLKVTTLGELKKKVEKYYNLQEKYIALREQQEFDISKKPQVIKKSSCFNLRFAEMYINYLLQNHTQSTTVCQVTVAAMVRSVNGMVHKDSEENRFIKNKKAKEQLDKLSGEVLAALASFKAENEFIE